MGCDIHVHVQYISPEDKRPEPTWWGLSESEIHWSRDYGLFMRLAGVRCFCDGRVYGEPCPLNKIKPRGQAPGGQLWPLDDGLHTTSWLTLAEVKEAIAGYDCGAEVYATLAAMEKLEELGGRTRLVFGFDS